MLTGTWLESEKLLAGLFFLLLLLLVPPPVLTVLPPDIFRFRRLFGACLAGSAAGTTTVMTQYLETFKHFIKAEVSSGHLPGGATIRCHF